jgi:hypothetical protein
MPTNFAPRSITLAGIVLIAGAMVAATRVNSYAPSAASSAASSPASSTPTPIATADDANADVARELTLPAGTVLPLTLDSYVASDTSRVEDSVRAHVRRAIVVNGRTIVPAGSTLIGNVTSVERPGRVKGRGYIAFRFSQLTTPDAGRVRIQTSRVARTAPATKKADAMKIALPAAGGAAIGAIVGGKKGAAIGAAAGGGAGTGVVLSTRGKDVRLGPGAAVSVRLLQPVELDVR